MGPLLTLKRFNRTHIVYTFYYPLFIVYSYPRAARGTPAASSATVRLYAIGLDFIIDLDSCMKLFHFIVLCYVYL